MTSRLQRRGGIGFNKTSDTGASDYEVSDNIVRGNGTAATDIRIGINLWDAGSGVLRVWNNVIYDFRTDNDSYVVAGIVPDDRNFTYYLYNNTIVDCKDGIDAFNAGTVVVAKNNLAYSNRVDNYWADTGVVLGPLEHQQPLRPHADGRAGIESPQRDHRHLRRCRGRRLSSRRERHWGPGPGRRPVRRSSLAFAVDVDRGPRRAPWDIGADELDGPTVVKLAPSRRGASSRRFWWSGRRRRSWTISASTSTGGVGRRAVGAAQRARSFPGSAPRPRAGSIGRSTPAS